MSSIRSINQQLNDHNQMKFYKNQVNLVLNIFIYIFLLFCPRITATIIP